jgi:hypothetical protein
VTATILAVIVAACAVAAICLTVAGAALGIVYAHSERITRVEERIRSVGQQLAALPKRRGD